MTDRMKNILIGLFVTGAVATMIGLVLFLKPTVGDGKKTMCVRFTNISGISVGTRVNFAGKPIGEVVHIQELPKAREMADDPRIDVSCLEAVIGTRYTVDTISYLRRRASGLRFVWIMGADNLAQFHRWQNWRRIASEVPIAVIDRPPQSFRALAAPAAQALARYRLPENQAARLADHHAPAWVFLTGMKSSLSSTGLRNPDGSWKAKK